MAAAATSGRSRNHSLLVVLLIAPCFQFWAYHAVQSEARLDGEVASFEPPPVVNQSASARRIVCPASNATISQEDMSSVDYFACCGLGHRLTKMTDAYYVSRFLNFSFRADWGFCDQIEVYSHLFGPQPYEEVAHRVQNQSFVLRFQNDVPHFIKLTRKGPKKPCMCSHYGNKEETDYQFYNGLRRRFRKKDQVKEYVRNYFANYTVLGIHVRAGNGEQGDFTSKQRGIRDMDEWIKGVAATLIDFAANFSKPPRVYLATDTASLVDLFRSHLSPTITVVDLPQDRIDEGNGVLFGERGRVHTEGNKCLLGWEMATMDMILLSHADVVIAARPSSFSQAMPMSIAFGKPNKTVNRPFCEFHVSGTKMRCFESFQQWCCEGGTKYILGNIQHYDYIRVPYELERREWDIKPRPSWKPMCRPTPKRPELPCLPYRFNNPYPKTDNGV